MKRKFQAYACAGDSIQFERGNYTIVATIVCDDGYDIDDDDCHNTDQSATGCDDEQFAKLLEAREAWNRDEWCYCGIVLSIRLGDAIVDDHIGSLWGLALNYPNSSDEYLNEVAAELVAEHEGDIQAAIDKFKELACN